MTRHACHALPVLLAVCVLVAPAGTATAQDSPTVSAATTEFGFELLRSLEREKHLTNLFISPLSVSLALAMTLNGAEGDTGAAMMEALALAGMDLEDVNTGYERLQRVLESQGSSVELAIANSIWTRAGFDVEPAFLERNRLHYEAEVASLDFDDPAAAGTINS